MTFIELLAHAGKPIHTTGILNMDRNQLEATADLFQELLDLHRSKDNFDDYSHDAVSDLASESGKRDSMRWAIEEQEKYAVIQVRISVLTEKLGLGVLA